MLNIVEVGLTNDRYGVFCPSISLCPPPPLPPVIDTMSCGEGGGGGGGNGAVISGTIIFFILLILHRFAHIAVYKGERLFYRNKANISC